MYSSPLPKGLIDRLYVLFQAMRDQATPFPTISLLAPVFSLNLTTWFLAPWMFEQPFMAASALCDLPCSFIVLPRAPTHGSVEACQLRENLPDSGGQRHLWLSNMVGRPKALSKIGNKEQHSHRQCFFNCLFAKRLHSCGGQKPSMVPDMSTGQAYRRPRAILMKASAPHPFVASQRDRSLKQFRNSFLARHKEYGFCKRFCPPQSNRKHRLRTYDEISWARNWPKLPQKGKIVAKFAKLRENFTKIHEISYNIHIDKFSWKSTKCHENSRSFTKFHENSRVSQNFTKIHQISRNFPKIHQISRKFMTFREISWKFTKFHENSANFTKIHQISRIIHDNSRNLTKFHEISRKIAAWNSVKFREFTSIDRL